MKKPTTILTLTLTTLLLVSCAKEKVKNDAASEPPARIVRQEQKPATEGDKLNAIVSDYTEAAKRLDPYAAPQFGVEEDLAKFGDYPSQAFYERARDLYARTIARLNAVKADQLAATDLQTYRLFQRDMQLSLADFNYPFRYLELTQMGNRLHSYLDDSSQALTDFPFDSVKHYEDFLKRSEEFPRYIERQIEVLRSGIEKKITLSCVVAKKVPNTYREALEPEVIKNPFYRPVLFMPREFPEIEQARLRGGFRKMVSERIVPGYKKFDEFFRKEYLPKCRQSFGIAGLPQGKTWYRHLILQRTDLELDPKEIHLVGLGEVKRIATEMTKIQKQLRATGSLRQFLKKMSTDPASFFVTSQEMFAAFEKTNAEIAVQIPKYFTLQPKSNFKLVESSNPEDAAGSYREPTDAMPFGRFIVNTKNLRSVPIFGVTTLLMHEAVPGHHFQLALQFEMKDSLSEYRRKLFSSNAFVEGWALYAEYLGNEMGMFKDPLQRLGHLNDEMLRAVRLVVDTGIHEFGWPKKRAMDFMARYLASDLRDIENEVNRYSVWPGQALGYKIGQLKIIELRRLAEKELGSQFDLREFHRVVIGSGSVSLLVLDTQVKEWIAARRLSSIN